MSFRGWCVSLAFRFAETSKQTALVICCELLGRYGSGGEILLRILSISSWHPMHMEVDELLMYLFLGASQVDDSRFPALSPREPETQIGVAFGAFSPMTFDDIMIPFRIPSIPLHSIRVRCIGSALPPSQPPYPRRRTGCSTRNATRS